MIRSRAGMNPEMPPPGQVTLSDYIEQVKEEEKSPLEKLMELCVPAAMHDIINLVTDREDAVRADRLEKFVKTVELFQKSRIKQIPALFKKGT